MWLCTALKGWKVKHDGLYTPRALEEGVPEP